MAKLHSAGILLYKFSASNELLLFLVHPGGPYWANKDEGAWSIPKGVRQAADDGYLETARREFFEEIGTRVQTELTSLGAFRQSSAKVIHVYAGRQDIDTDTIVSNDFELEWPAKSGERQRFPEIDRAEWFDYATAQQKILAGQLPILRRLLEVLDCRT